MKNSPLLTTESNSLKELILGFRISQMIYVAARLGLADQLQAGPQTVTQLAKSVNAEPTALYRLLRALASLGLFAENHDGSFVLTPSAELLRSDAAGSLRSLAMYYGEDWVWQAYGGMLSNIQTGKTAFEKAHGASLYTYLEAHPVALARFQQAMTTYAELEAAAIVEAYNFSQAKIIVDVGGGQGALTSALLQAQPQLYGVIFDQAKVVAGADSVLASAGIADRATCIGGDFFTAVPPGGDLYILKSIVHNWDNDAAVRILRNCRKAMTENARLLVVERVIQPGNVPDEAKLFDMNMLVMLGGVERTEAEFEELFFAAGFQLSRIIPTNSPSSLIEGLPVLKK